MKKGWLFGVCLLLLLPAVDAALQCAPGCAPNCCDDYNNCTLGYPNPGQCSPTSCGGGPCESKACTACNPDCGSGYTEYFHKCPAADTCVADGGTRLSNGVCCGDDPGEPNSSYVEDPVEVSCTDGFDNDCDSLVDSQDPNCGGGASLTGNCTIKSACNASETRVLRAYDVVNTHAELATGTAPYEVCCPGTNLSAVCTGKSDSDAFMTLTSPANAHVSEDAYPVDACLSIDSLGSVECRFDASCGPGESCIARMSSSFNAHIEDCSGSWPVVACCEVGGCIPENETGAKCEDGEDNDCDGFVDCADVTGSNSNCSGYPGTVYQKTALNEYNWTAPENVTGTGKAYAGGDDDAEFTPEPGAFYETLIRDVSDFCHGACYPDHAPGGGGCDCKQGDTDYILVLNESGDTVGIGMHSSWCSSAVCGRAGGPTWDCAAACGIGAGPEPDVPVAANWTWNETTACPDCSVDNDTDGYSPQGPLCGPVDCDDYNASVNPGTGEVCTSNPDENCDGERNYDGWDGSGYVSRGDAACPVGIPFVNTSTPEACVNEWYLLECNSTVPDVRSVEYFIDNGTCHFMEWSGSTARFRCKHNTSGLWNVGCSVNETESYADPAPNRTRAVWVNVSNAFCPTCGNGIVESPEHCDGSSTKTCADFGMSGGAVPCNEACEYDTSACTTSGGYCGDGDVNTTEQCEYPGDAPPTTPAMTCTDVPGYSAGVGNLTCDEVCILDTSQCCYDNDGDTYGAGCVPGPDCDDNNASIHPGVAPPEICDDNKDNDCNGRVDCADPWCIANVAYCEPIIEGYVFDQHGNPLPGATVKILYAPAGNTTLSNATGQYHFGDVPIGIHNMDAQKPSYFSQSKLADFSAGGLLEVNFTLRNETCTQCLDQDGRCELTCVGTDQCPAASNDMPEVCDGRKPGSWASYNATHFIKCCGDIPTGPYRKKVDSTYTVDGCMPNLVPYTRVVRYLGQPVKLVFYVWEPCE